MGVSFETLHFTAAFAMFDHVSQLVETLLQMLRRFRNIFIVHVHLGLCRSSKLTFDERLAVAKQTTEEHHGGNSVQIGPEVG